MTRRPVGVVEGNTHPARSIAMLLVVLLVASCGGAGPSDVGPAGAPSSQPTKRDGVVQVSDASRYDGEVVTVEGSLSVRDSQEVRLCRNISFGGPAPECLGQFLVVKGLDLDQVPRLSRAGAVRFAWPSILLEGRVEGGVLTVTRLPPVYRLRLEAPTDRSVTLDRSGGSQEAQISPGQDVGIVSEAWSDFGSRTVSSGGGRLHLSMAQCPPNASCFAGYVQIDTSDIAAGLYEFVERGVRVAIRVTEDQNPGETSTDWSLPSERA